MQAEGLPNAAGDACEIVRFERTEFSLDDLFVDGKQLRDADGAWMPQARPTPVPQRAVTRAGPPVEPSLTADWTHDDVWKRSMKLLRADVSAGLRFVPERSEKGTSTTTTCPRL